MEARVITDPAATVWRPPQAASSRSEVTTPEEALTVDAETLNSSKLCLSHFVLHLHGLRGLTILHVVFEIVENSVEVHCIELDGHF